MIETTEELYQAIEQMGRMQRILESYRTDILPKNPRNFAIFAEGPLDEIRKLQTEIADYVTDLKGSKAQPPRLRLRPFVAALVRWLAPRTRR